MIFDFDNLSINGENLIKLSVGEYVIWEKKTVDDGLTHYWIGDEEYTIDIEGTLNFSSLFLGSVTKVVIGSKVNKLSDFCFNACDTIKTIYIPDSVQNIGEYAFPNCSSLKEVNIPSGITEIRKAAFFKNTSLENIIIPDTVTKIGDSAFNGCISLTAITIPDSVVDIGFIAFGNVPTEGELTCSDEWYDNLSSTQIGKLGNVYNWRRKPINPPVDEPTEDGDTIVWYVDGTVQKYNYSGILDWSKIPNFVNAVKIEFGKQITSLNYEYGYYDIANSLTSVTIPSNITHIGGEAFAHCPNLKYVNSSNEYEFILKEGLVTLGYSVFNSSNVKTLILPSTLEIIGKLSFNGCSSLTSVTIPDNVKEIHNNAFSLCTSLTSFNIGGGVQKIERGVLTKSPLLTDITYNGTVQMFENIDKEDGYFLTEEYDHEYHLGTNTIVCTDGIINII